MSESAHPHNLVAELIERPDECVQIDYERADYALVRWQPDAEVFEVVEKRGTSISERYEREANYVASMVAIGRVNAWLPLSHFVATCNPGDRPVIEA